MISELWRGLPVRAQNCLANAGYWDATKEQIKLGIEDGMIAWKGKKKAKNFGKKSFIEVCEWAGAIPPGQKKCPYCGR
jgi:hypothetical protein